MERKRERPERELTDESLTCERRKTEDELDKRSAKHQENADEVVATARRRADEVLSNARRAEDEKLSPDGSGDARAAVHAERQQTDETLSDERSSADVTLASERAGGRRTLLTLLAAEREQTDAHLLSERESADQAASSRDLQLQSANRATLDLRRRLETAHEEERHRIARDLHDEAGQTLVAITLALKMARDHDGLPPDLGARLLEVQVLLQQLGRELHEIAVRLRPTALDDLGLFAAAAQLVADWSKKTNVEVDLQQLELAKRLPAAMETALYRVLQEALTNVAKHAAAGRVSVIFALQDEQLNLIVEDDGSGFDVTSVDAGRIGLLGMRERIAHLRGSLDIESAPGAGTTLIARLPLRSAVAISGA